jgi:hypothetical protein
MQWAICLVQLQLKSTVLSAIEMQYTPHHSGTKYSYSDALSLLVTRCMKSSNSKTYTSARSELTIGKHAGYGPPVLITAVVQMSGGPGTLQYAVSGTAVVQISGGPGSLQYVVSAIAVVQMSGGPGTLQYAVSGTAVVHRCQWVMALHGT